MWKKIEDILKYKEINENYTYIFCSNWFSYKIFIVRDQKILTIVEKKLTEHGDTREHKFLKIIQKMLKVWKCTQFRKKEQKINEINEKIKRKTKKNF